MALLNAAARLPLHSPERRSRRRAGSWQRRRQIAGTGTVFGRGHVDTAIFCGAKAQLRSDSTQRHVGYGVASSMRVWTRPCFIRMYNQERRVARRARPPRELWMLISTSRPKSPPPPEFRPHQAPRIPCPHNIWNYPPELFLIGINAELLLLKRRPKIDERTNSATPEPEY